MNRLMISGAIALLAGGTLGVALVNAQNAAPAKPAAAPAPAAAAPAAAPATQPGGLDLSKNPDRISYAIGMKIALDMSHSQMKINPEAFIAGFAEAVGGKSRLKTEEMIQTVMAAEQEARSAAEGEFKKMADKNKAEGEAYLAKNKTAAGVKTTASGLQYKVVKEGTGKTPTVNDTVTVKYRGTLTNGTEFDNSERHGGTVSFPVGGVVPGWTEALLLMKVGSKYQLTIPSELAYGEQGAGRVIAPNSVLLFDIELVEVKEAGTPTAKPK